MTSWQTIVVLIDVKPLLSKVTSVIIKAFTLAKTEIPLLRLHPEKPLNIRGFWHWKAIARAELSWCFGTSRRPSSTTVQPEMRITVAGRGRVIPLKKPTSAPKTRILPCRFGASWFTLQCEISRSLSKNHVPKVGGMFIQDFWSKWGHVYGSCLATQKTRMRKDSFFYASVFLALMWSTTGWITRVSTMITWTATQILPTVYCR